MSLMIFCAGSTLWMSPAVCPAMNTFLYGFLPNASLSVDMPFAATSPLASFLIVLCCDLIIFFSSQFSSPAFCTYSVLMTEHGVPDMMSVITMSSDVAFMIACLYSWLAVHSSVAMNLVPMYAASAPSSSAALKLLLSAIPPACSTGMSSACLSSGISIVGVAFPACPPAPAVTATTASAPSSCAFSAYPLLVTSHHAWALCLCAVSMIRFGVPRLVMYSGVLWAVHTSRYSSFFFFMSEFAMMFTPYGLPVIFLSWVSALSSSSAVL